MSDCSNSVAIEPPEDIYKVHLITTLPESGLINIWIPCWYSTNHNSLFWIEDLRVPDLQPSFYNPKTLQTILLKTVTTLGFSLAETPPHIGRSWGGQLLDTDKENQVKFWLICYLSCLFDKRSPSQKVFLSPNDARIAGVRSVIPIFLDPSWCSDKSSPYLIVPSPTIFFSLSSFLHSRELIIDYSGTAISVTFQSKPILTTCDRIFFSRATNASVFFNSTHFHSVDDIVTLKNIFLSLNFEDNFSTLEWIPILQKDSSLLLRELLQILFRALTVVDQQAEQQVLTECSHLLKLCWKIDPYGAIGDFPETDAFFRTVVPLLNVSTFHTLPIVPHIASVLEYIARQTPITHHMVTSSSYASVIDSLVSYLLNTENHDPQTNRCLQSLLSTLWFRNILNCLPSIPEMATSPSSTYCLHQQLILIFEANSSDVSKIFGTFSGSHVFDTLATLIPPVCSWMSQVFLLNNVDLNENCYTLRYLTSALTLLLIIQQSTNSTINFFPDWELLHHCLNFLLLHKAQMKVVYYLSCVQTMIQLVDFLNYVFVHLEWLQKSSNCKLYRDTILQV